MLFLCGEDNSVRGFEADRGSSGGYSSQGILDLDELAGRATIKSKIYLQIDNIIFLRSPFIKNLWSCFAHQQVLGVVMTE